MAFSPLVALMAIGRPTEIKIRYSGSSLGSVLSHLKTTDALTVLPHSVVFPFRKEVDHFAQHVGNSFETLKHPIKRHEQAVIWGA